MVVEVAGCAVECGVVAVSGRRGDDLGRIAGERFLGAGVREGHGDGLGGGVLGLISTRMEAILAGALQQVVDLRVLGDNANS